VEPPPAPIHHRKDAPTPPPVGPSAADALPLPDQQRKAVADYRGKNPNASFQRAWDAVKQANPELFRSEDNPN